MEELEMQDRGGCVGEGNGDAVADGGGSGAGDDAVITTRASLGSGSGIFNRHSSHLVSLGEVVLLQNRYFLTDSDMHFGHFFKKIAVFVNDCSELRHPLL